MPRVLIGVLVGAGGIVATVLTVWGVARTPVLQNPVSAAAWRGAFVASYGRGRAYTWWRGGESPLVAAVGFLYSLASINAHGTHSGG